MAKYSIAENRSKAKGEKKEFQNADHAVQREFCV